MGMEQRDIGGKVRDVILDSVSKGSVGYPRGDRQLGIWGRGQRSLETWGPQHEGGNTDRVGASQGRVSTARVHPAAPVTLN